MRKSGFLIMASFLLSFCLSGAMAQPAEPTLPDNLKIEPPAAGVSPRLAQLSGIWEGVWEKYKGHSGPGGTMRKLGLDDIGWGAKIAIVKITPPNVEAIYARPGKSFQVKEASVVGDTIVLKWGKPGEKKIVTLSPSNNPHVANAAMDLEHTGRTFKATLRKK